MYRIIARQGKARTGILTTKSGRVHTPAFMPVNTKACAKFVTTQDLIEMDVEALISNSFVLYLNPGLKRVGDLHDFMNFHRTIFTDCGAFQMLREGFFEGYNDHGIRFKNPFNGQKVLLTPADVIKIQKSLNSDVAMALDNLPAHEKSEEEVEKAVEMTIKWHARCKEKHSEIWKGKKRQLLFGIGQGSLNAGLRKKCLRELLKLDFDGYALGGLCIGESKQEMLAMIKASKEVIPAEKPVYLMGVGSPEDILAAIGEGVDIFDSVYPTQLARHSTLFTWDGYLRIKSSRYAHDEGPIDAKCNCYVCKNYTRKYIHYLSKVDEPTSKIYKSYHNLYFLQALVRQCQKEIGRGTFAAFKNSMIRKYEATR